MGPEFYVGIVGLVLLPFFAWLLSSDKNKIMWKTVIVGLVIQLVLGALVMLTGPGQQLFRILNDVIVGLLEFSNEGAAFLFGRLVDSDLAALENSRFQQGAEFAFSVLPTIIFFSSFMAVLYFTGIMRKLVEFIAWIMMKLMGTSGAETLSVSSNIFVGQTEAPLVIKPFVRTMTRSELATVMTGGFATVAGGVMAAFVSLLSPEFPAIAGHLITASVMSAPAAIVMSKLVYPEKEVPMTRGEVKVEIDEQGVNLIDAAAKGAKTGLTLALNVGAMLLAFIALVYLGNFLINWFSTRLHLLVTELTGLQAFWPGAMLGGLFALVFVGRWGWREELSKKWFAVISLVFFLPAALYLLLPELSPGLAIDPVLPALGMVIGLVVGLLSSYYLCVEQIGLLGKSLSIQLLTMVVFGGISYLVGGSDSSVVAAGLFATVVLFLILSFWLWKSPTFKKFGQLLWIAVVGVILVGLIVHLTGLDFLTVLAGLNLEKIIGYIFSLFAFVMGVPWEDLIEFGQLIGTKMAINEFVAFLNFRGAIELLNPRSVVMLSYALCGFANFSSIAIQIGGIGGIAPNREGDLAQLGFKTMLAGTLASYQTATVAGVMFGIASYLGIDLVQIV